MAGIFSIDDIRQRCFVHPETRCWVWSMACDKTTGEPMVWVASLRKRLTAGGALAYFSTGQTTTPKRQLVPICQTKGCCNPGHRQWMDKSEHMRRCVPHKSDLARAKISAGRRRGKGAVATVEMAARVLDFEGSARQAAAHFGLGLSTVYEIRRKRVAQPVLANASIFHQASAL